MNFVPGGDTEADSTILLSIITNTVEEFQRKDKVKKTQKWPIMAEVMWAYGNILMDVTIH